MEDECGGKDALLDTEQELVECVVLGRTLNLADNEEVDEEAMRSWGAIHDRFAPG